MNMLRILILLLSVLTLTPIEIAQAFSISPMKLRFDGSGDTQVIKLRNTHERSRSVQLKVFAWKHSDDPAKLEPTNDLLVIPPIFAIDPGDEQIVRIGLRNASDATKEQTYRVLISETPSEVDEREGLNFNLEVNLPIFVVPEGAVAQPQWSYHHDEAFGSGLVLENQGNAHVKIRSIDLYAPDGKVETINIGSASYVFGGEQRRWPLDIDLAKLKGPITVKADSSIGPIETTVAIPEG